MRILRPAGDPGSGCVWFFFIALALLFALSYCTGRTAF